MVHGEHLDCTWSVSGRFIKGVWGVFVVDFCGGSLWWYVLSELGTTPMGYSMCVCSGCLRRVMWTVSEMCLEYV